jgi:hypothetical protein
MSNDRNIDPLEDSYCREFRRIENHIFLGKNIIISDYYGQNYVFEITTRLSNDNTRKGNLIGSDNGALERTQTISCALDVRHTHLS